MSVFRPRALIFFILGWPGAPILDAVGLLFGFRGALGALIAASLVSLEGCRKKPAPQYCIAGTLWWKMVQKGVPKVYPGLVVLGTFWGPCSQGYPPRCKNPCTCRAIRKNQRNIDKNCIGGTISYLPRNTENIAQQVQFRTCRAIRKKLHRRYHFLPDMQSQRLLTKTLPTKRLHKGSTIPHLLARR